MTAVNPHNERIKRRYFEYLAEAEGLSSKTIDHTRLALVRYDAFTDHRDYRSFATADAKGFKRKLLENEGKRRAELSSRSTVHSILGQVQKFFRWLAGQPGYKKAVAYSDVAYFSLPARDRRIASHRSDKPTPSLEQVQQVVRTMPATTDLDLRNRAVVACALLTGARVSALISLKLKHVRTDRLGIDQDAREVDTKFGKSFPTFFFPVGDDIRQIFLDYVDYLRSVRLFNGNDPLFPRTLQTVGDSHMFEATGFERCHWVTPEPVRIIFRRAFATAGLPYFSPHAFRRTLTRLGQQICTTPELLKAWSQNLGHDEVLTTFTSYGALPSSRQAQLIGSLSSIDEDGRVEALQKLLQNPDFRALVSARNADSTRG